jgi:hypothetical protein
VHSPGLDRLGLALQRELAEILEQEEAIRRSLGPLADHNLPGTGYAEQAGRQVHRVAHRRVVHPEVPADGADDDEAGIDAHADPEGDVVPALDVLPERPETLLDRDRRADRSVGVVLVGDRRAEEGHDAVAEELVHRAFVAVDRVEDHLEGAVHDQVDVLGIEAFRHGRKPRDVREHHRDLLPLALEHVTALQDLLGKVLGRVRGRRRVPHGHTR